jgi:4-oxalocrotonate tautomerase
MPVLSYEGPKLTKEQKEKLIKEMTDTAARVVPDIPKQAYYFFVREYDDENVGVGGMTLQEYLKSIRAGG